MFARVAIVLAAIGLTFTLMRGVSSIVAPAFLALNLVIVAYPVFRWLTVRKVPRPLAATVSLLLILGVLALFIWGISYSVTAMVQQLSSYQAQFINLYHQLLDLLTRVGFSQDMLLSKLKTIDPNQVLSISMSLLSNAQGGLALLSMLVLSLLFMSMDSSSAHARLDAAAQTHPGFVAGLYAFSDGVRRYWVITTIFGLIVAVLDWGVLAIMGVPLALVWGLLSFLTNYIPNIGFVIGLVPPALLALFDKGWVASLVVVVAYIVLNFVVQSIIQPKVAGDAVGVSPTLSFLSLFLWTWVFGALGALIALPCTLLVKAMLIDGDPSMRWLDPLISGSLGKGEPAHLSDDPGSAIDDASTSEAHSTPGTTGSEPASA